MERLVCPCVCVGGDALSSCACCVQEMCVRYWPESIGQTEVYGTFQVEVCADERVLGEYTVRKLKLSPVDMVGGAVLWLL